MRKPSRCNVQRRRSAPKQLRHNQQQPLQPRMATSLAAHPTSEEAGCTFAELVLRGDPRPAAQETHIPTISRAWRPTESDRLTLLRPDGTDNRSFAARLDEDAIPAISLVNSEETAAYSLLPKPIAPRLQHAAGMSWGQILAAVRHTRVHENVFQAPPPGEFVAVKKLNKRVVDAYLRQGRENPVQRDLRHLDEAYLHWAVTVAGRENPYREMSRMEQYGDNIHVLRQIEFLQDDDFVYIVMPRACERGSLDQVIFNPLSPNPLSPAEAQDLFVQILCILHYLQERNLHHRDLSPDNFLFLTPDHLVLMDFAMSARIPTITSSSSGQRQQQRTLMQTMGMFGTCAFMAPEIWHRCCFDGVAADLWAAVLILFSMLTKLALYRKPDANIDILFRYFVLAGALRPPHEQDNELIADVLNDTYSEQQQREMQERAMAYHVRLPEDARELFRSVFRIDPSARWTLAQVMQSNFCTKPQQD